MRASALARADGRSPRSTARDLLDRFSSQYPLFDGPTQTLLQHILACESEPPSDWAGYRVLRVRFIRRTLFVLCVKDCY